VVVQGRLSDVGISAREAEVLAALGERLSNAEIGARLFISVRPVESHVSSLLRKLQVDDRRALAAVAGNLHSAPVSSADGPIAVAAVPPSSLTPFVGRVAEQAALSAALEEHRLVTAVGPGGVGKTRLAWSVAAALSDRIADGVWYVDLVPVTDPLMIAPAIADVLGLGERAGSSAAETVLGSSLVNAAGAPTAMLLARRGYRVLVVDRAEFPADTISTHLVHPPGVAALERWGLLDGVVGSGCPGIHTYSYDFGSVRIEGATVTDEAPAVYAPRRTVLDHLLVKAAEAAGADVRQAFSVESLLVEDGRVTGIRGKQRGGSTVTHRARVVVGADGHRSVVARQVGAEQYLEKPELQISYYTYLSGLPMDGRYEACLRPGRGFAAWPTNDDQTVVIAGWPIAELAQNRTDIEGNFGRTLELVPEFAERYRAARRTERFAGQSMANFLRKPFGAGWALVGDAGYTKDFITGLGISDAFRDAELCARALDEFLSGERPFEIAKADYHAARDRSSLPIYEFTAQLATLESLSDDLEQLLLAIRGNQEAMDEFTRVGGAVTSPADFFSEANVRRLLAPDPSREPA
jgi:2-polyprenyl-6-methoxyphenol hydroxylase-like FAD-dependent oxidoreductase/DNA-binding CsgD family transcriptional regulator